MLLSDYIDVGKYFEDNGVFDPVLDNDNGFFINILRLKTAKTHEFQESYQSILLCIVVLRSTKQRCTLSCNEIII